MNDAELAAAVDSNYWESFALMTKACGGDVLSTDEVLAISTGLPIAMLNVGFVRKPLTDPENSIREILQFYDAIGLPFVLRVREGVDPRAEEAMQATGLPYSDTVPGMAMYPIPSPPAAGLEIEMVRDGRTLSRFQQVAASGFGMPLEFVERLMGPRFLDAPGFESYLGYVDGEPAAVSSSCSGGDVVGVYNVATLGTHRRRGLGAAMTWHAVSRGLEAGCSIATLQASEMGKPVYERMGFRTVAPYRTFHRTDKEAS